MCSVCLLLGFDRRKGIYEEDLGIYQEVDKEKRPDMLDQLALGC